MQLPYHLAVFVIIISHAAIISCEDDDEDVVMLDCPVECTCDKSEYEVDCSYLSLTEIPTNGIPINTKKLSLAGNEISTLLDEWMSTYTLLEELDLSDNSLTTITEDTFKRGESLYSLNLASNNIDSIADLTFNETPNLKILNLKNNQFTEIPSQLYYASGLRELDVQDNPISEFGSSVFAYVLSLQELSIGGDPDIIGTPTIDKNALEGLSSLAVFNMSGLDIAVLDEGFLNPAISLTDLYMSSVIATSISSVTFEDVTTLTTLDMSYNTDLPFDSTALEPLTELKVLILKDSSIEELPENFLSAAQNLESVCLEYNMLTSLDSVVSESLELLNTLLLSHNDLTDVPTDALNFTPGLTNLTLDNNDIGSVEGQAFSALVALTTLDLSENSIETIAEDGFEGLTSVVTLDLSGNSLTSLPATTLDEMSALEVLNLDDNVLTCDCDMIGFREWLISETPGYSDDITCSSPSTVSGTAVADVSEDEMCSVEIIYVEINATVQVMTGQTVHLPCYTYHNDTTVPSEWTLPENSQAVVDEEGTLIISNVSATDSGDYVCDTVYSSTYKEVFTFSLSVTDNECEHYIPVAITSDSDEITVDWTNSTVEGVDTYTVTYSEGWPNASQDTTSVVMVGKTVFKLKSRPMSNVVICVTAEHEECDDSIVHAEYCQEVHGISEHPSSGEQNKGDGSMSLLTIIGLIAVILFIVIAVFMMIYCTRRQRKKEDVTRATANHNSHGQENTGNGGVEMKLLDNSGTAAGENDESVV